jgi:hypothetical protein
MDLSIRSDPRIGRSGIIDIGELLLVRTSSIGDLCSRVGSHVAQDDRSVLEELFRGGWSKTSFHHEEEDDDGTVPFETRNW